MKNKLMSFLSDESAATAIEYGLLAGLISVVIIVSVQSLGTKLSNQFNAVAAKLN